VAAGQPTRVVNADLLACGDSLSAVADGDDLRFGGLG
jgi:hypothetical protein